MQQSQGKQDEGELSDRTPEENKINHEKVDSMVGIKP